MNNVLLVANILLAAALGTAHHHAKPARPTALSTTTRLAAASRHQRALAPRTTRKRVASRSTSLTYTVTATAYQAVPGQTDNEPFITADNSRIKPHYSSKTRWLALSQDLLTQRGGKFNYGDKVRVRGLSPKLDGVYTVHDTMNKRHRHCIDILTHMREKLDLFSPGVKIQLVAAAPIKNPPLAGQPTRDKLKTRPAAVLASHRPRRARKTETPRLCRNPFLTRRRANYLASAIL